MKTMCIGYYVPLTTISHFPLLPEFPLYYLSVESASVKKQVYKSQSPFNRPKPLRIRKKLCINHDNKDMNEITLFTDATKEQQLSSETSERLHKRCSSVS